MIASLTDSLFEQTPQIRIFRYDALFDQFRVLRCDTMLQHLDSPELCSDRIEWCVNLTSMGAIEPVRVPDPARIRFPDRYEA
jgi:hypothetical protein